MLLNAIFVIHIRSEPAYHFTSALNNTTKYDVECEEVAPNCSGTVKYESGILRDYYMSDNMNVNFIQMEYGVDSLHNVCRFDPFWSLHGSHNISLDDVNFITIIIDCHAPGTRLVISTLNISTQAMVSIRSRHCALYWKDISAIGRSVYLISLVLDDWSDEFDSDEPAYFTTCVQLKNFSVDVEEERPRLAIAGLADIREIVVECDSVQPISPVFTHQLWPGMVEFYCAR